MITGNPIDGLQLDPADIKDVGEDFQRSKFILAKLTGNLWAADLRGGVVKITPGGCQNIISQKFERMFSQATNAAT